MSKSVEVNYGEKAAIEALISLTGRTRDVGERLREEMTDILVRAYAAADADTPTLPEGEVVYRDSQDQRILLIHREGYLYASRTASHAWAAVHHLERDRLEPYVPVFSPQAVDRVAMTLMRMSRPPTNKDDWVKTNWVEVKGYVRERYRRYAREVLKAAGAKIDGEMDKPWLEDTGKEDTGKEDTGKEDTGKKAKGWWFLRQGSEITLDLSPWPESKAEDWRKEASILRDQRPDAQAAAALCDAVADAMEAQGVRGPSL